MITDAQRHALVRRLGEECVITSPEALATYAYDATTTWEKRPDVVVAPTTREQVALLLDFANAEGIPVTPRGGGTNLSGGSVPIHGGIALTLTRMSRVLSIEPGNLTVRCEAGVILADLDRALAAHGLFFPPDPQSVLGATVGGAIAENASGPAGLKYGVTKHYVLGLTIVLADGRVAEIGGATVKNVVGYDLPQLITGSEGTLAVICDAILKVLPRPPARRTVLATFDHVTVACENVERLLAEGVVPAKIELLDRMVLDAIERIRPLGLPAATNALLLFELDGSAESAAEQARTVIDLCRENGARDVRAPETETDAQAFWKARSAGFAAVFGSAPTVIAEDVTVPRSRIPDFVRRVEEICAEAGLTYTVLGHAGDGNLHPTILTDIADPAHYRKARHALERILELAAEFGGVLSGEHGIGLEKKEFLGKVTDPAILDTMKGIKAVFDPNHILNPGKIWP